MSVRESITDQTLTDWAGIPVLSGVKVTDTERAIGELRTITAVIRQKGVGREPSAPMSHRRVRMMLTIISPLANADAATDELEPAVWAALDYLDTRYQHDDAEQVGWRVSDTLTYLAYDIPFTVIASKE